MPLNELGPINERELQQLVRESPDYLREDIEELLNAKKLKHATADELLESVDVLQSVKVQMASDFVPSEIRTTIQRGKNEVVVVGTLKRPYEYELEVVEVNDG